MWVILCPRRKHHTNKIGEDLDLASPARARKRSDVTRGHMWAKLNINCAVLHVHVTKQKSFSIVGHDLHVHGAINPEHYCITISYSYTE